MLGYSSILLCFPNVLMIAKHISVVAEATSSRKRQAQYLPAETSWPPVTVLKPLCGLEPGLLEAIESFFKLDYPRPQVVFGAHSADDPALQIVRKLATIYTDADIAIITDPSVSCRNRKVANLINMLPAASHDVIVVSDSDMHVCPSYLKRVVSELMSPGVGLVTTLYTGRPGCRSFAANLGLAYINWYFVPGALLGAALGRQDCFGATMALRRTTLHEVGDFQMIGDQLADDAALGRRVREAGLMIKLAQVFPQTTIPEKSVWSLLQHELRWAVTMRSVAPISFGLSILQYPTLWAGLALFTSPLDPFLAGNFMLVWLAQWGLATCIDKSFCITTQVSPLLIPVREFLSVGVIVWSFFCSNVTWRGESFCLGHPQGWLANIHVGRWARTLGSTRAKASGSVEISG